MDTCQVPEGGLVGAILPFRCPVDGCRYIAILRLGEGEETVPAAHAERLEMLRREHPSHPGPPRT